jgi:hypothetical protein
MAQPFPAGSHVDELDELHAELAYADAMVADIAIPMAKREIRVGDVPEQVRTELADVQTRARRYEHAPGDEAELAASYRVYAELLSSLLEEIQSAQEPGS